MNSFKREPAWLYTMARAVFGAALHTVFPVVYHHKERVYQEPPFILISNHKSLLDPFAVALPNKQYNVRFLAKKELTKGKFAAWVMRHMLIIPVDRHNTDLNAMRQCVKTLRSGQILGIFPEGTRHLPDLMSEVETGTAVLALRANVPLLPAYIDGKIRLFRKTHVYYGEPMDISDLAAQGMNADTIGQTTDRIRTVFLAMRDKARSGKE